MWRSVVYATNGDEILIFALGDTEEVYRYRRIVDASVINSPERARAYVGYVLPHLVKSHVERAWTEKELVGKMIRYGWRNIRVYKTDPVMRIVAKTMNLELQV